MCKALNKKGYVCGLEPTKEFCHVHRPKVDLATLEALKQLRIDNTRLKATCELLMAESTDLSLKLKKQSKGKTPKSTGVVDIATHKKTDTQIRIRAKREVADLSHKWERSALQLQQEIDKLKAKLADVTKLNNQMHPDYERYQIIKSFEGLHQQLENVDFVSRGNLYHDLRLTRNKVAHPAMC